MATGSKQVTYSYRRAPVGRSCVSADQKTTSGIFPFELWYYYWYFSFLPFEPKKWMDRGLLFAITYPLIKELLTKPVIFWGIHGTSYVIHMHLSKIKLKTRKWLLLFVLHWDSRPSGCTFRASCCTASILFEHSVLLRWWPYLFSMNYLWMAFLSGNI